jgi:hypothetical protein
MTTAFSRIFLSISPLDTRWNQDDAVNPGNPAYSKLNLLTATLLQENPAYTRPYPVPE